MAAELQVRIFLWDNSHLTSRLLLDDVHGILLFPEIETRFDLEGNKAFTTACQCGLIPRSQDHSDYQPWGLLLKCFPIETEGSWTKEDFS